jgi:glutamate N-acetyltransferase/amino-acid N-acetyltransferase
VRGGNGDSVEAVARAVANSPLVKAALHGGDPNWGRIVQAVGAALPGTAPLAVDVAIEGIEVCLAGAAIPYDKDALDAAVEARQRSSTRSGCLARAPRPRSSSPTSPMST